MSAEGGKVFSPFLRPGCADHLVTGVVKLTDQRDADRPGGSDDHDSHTVFLLGYRDESPTRWSRVGNSDGLRGMAALAVTSVVFAGSLV